ncbi:hypothetical protein LINGRAPRIM_LOCUS2346, partial [Linum grandiflorum]
RIQYYPHQAPIRTRPSLSYPLIYPYLKSSKLLVSSSFGVLRAAGKPNSRSWTGDGLLFLPDQKNWRAGLIRPKSHRQSGFRYAKLRSILLVANHNSNRQRALREATTVVQNSYIRTRLISQTDRKPYFLQSPNSDEPKGSPALF